jgi:phosphatidylglycerophosphate synthase
MESKRDVDKMPCNGERLSAPYINFVPSAVHPNHITCINLMFNLILYIFALYAGYVIRNDGASHSNNTLRVCLILCGSMTYIGVVLDCLDGMVARERRQTSKTGEFLDYWCDALNTPLITSGIGFVLRFTGIECALVIVSISGLYCAQLISQNVQKDFVAVTGVEGKILTAICYVVACFTTSLSDSHVVVYCFARLIFGIGFCVSTLSVCSFMKDFRWREGTFLLLFLYSQLIIAYLYCDMSYVAYSWLACVSALSLNGRIVFFNVSKQSTRALVTMHEVYTALILSILCCIQMFSPANVQEIERAPYSLKSILYGIVLVVYTSDAGQTLLQAMRHFKDKRKEQKTKCMTRKVKQRSHFMEKRKDSRTLYKIKK